MVKFIIPDLDLDMSEGTRKDILQSLYHIPASKINDKGINPHGIGVYYSDIPYDRITGLASIDYKRAEEEFGYIKVDLLHNSVYDAFKTRTDLFKTLDEPVNWNDLYKRPIVEKLPHINSYFTLICELPKIMNVENLARFIAIIRPGKKHLIEKVKKENNWECISDEIWEKPLEGYYYKHSHAVAFALSIIVALNSQKVLINTDI